MLLALFFQKNIWALSVLVFLPFLGWVWFFQRQHREKKKYVALAFIAGMISVLPIKIYERYWSTAVLYIEHTNLFRLLGDLVKVPNLERLLSFLLVSLIVSTLIYVFIMIMMMILELSSGDNNWKTFKRKIAVISDSPLLFLSVGLFIGLVAFTSWLTLHEKVWFFLMVGMIEEFTKHLCLRFADEDKICSMDDALAFSIIGALGFAFLENILYFRSYMQMAPSLAQIGTYFILRSSVSVLAHVSFSAIFGYFYGLAQFGSEIYQQETKEGRHPFMSAVHRVCHINMEPIFREEKMFEGMVAAMILHAIFNSLLEFEKMGLMFMLLAGMLIIVINLYHRKHLHHALGHFMHESKSSTSAIQQNMIKTTKISS